MSSSANPILRKPDPVVATLRSVLTHVFVRDLRIALRRRADTLAALIFFVMVVSLFPIGVGPEPKVLRMIGPGVVWVAAPVSLDVVAGPTFFR